MVTVSFIGGPQSNFNVFAALRSWLTPNDAVVPEEEIFTPGQSQQQVLQQDTEQMVSSQQTATAAALCQLNINFKTVDTIQVVEKHRPATGVLRRGDVITAVDGTPVTCRHDAATMIRDRKPGAPVTLTVLRGGTSRPVTLHTANVGGVPQIGVQVGESFVFPFKVKISIGNIGGPSAGMMFALGIIDKLTNQNLTGGKFIAGTGEIEVNGNVDPIGGIQQKMAGARAAGATVFLTPASQLPGHLGRGAGRAAADQGEHAERRDPRPQGAQAGPARPELLARAAGPRSSNRGRATEVEQEGEGAWPSVLQANPGRPAARSRCPAGRGASSRPR